MPHGNFHRLIDRFGPFTQIDASFYYSNIVCAIGFIHKHGLVSRDIKSENFLIGPDGYLVMTDLGLAERVGGDGTWNNVGTPQYMAPELIEPGYSMGRAVDWWASGVMLYEMLTKRVVCLPTHPQHLRLLLPSWSNRLIRCVLFCHPSRSRESVICQCTSTSRCRITHGQRR